MSTTTKKHVKFNYNSRQLNMQWDKSAKVSISTYTNP